ncbi:hypothetical protein MAPG_02978 [Magnaporthiopsis poae ATCC 64411]|uniref:Uncharacterized protein n=1 Tax=Magnaporthiopsis poae (strain ATCC 64411 / 73-15) TaxID=644358 RepID=A0A0C4DST7_MAGP6|nr:hypothetical protein MAPG_02978 [Magnaporthiopsis poae ATCC 64411]
MTSHWSPRPSGMFPMRRYEALKPADSSAPGLPLSFNLSRRRAKGPLMKTAMAEKLASWSDDDIQSNGIPSRQLIVLYRQYANCNSSGSEIET